MSQLLSAELIARWRNGEQNAATILFDRYFDRLIALARKHLSPRLAGRLDPQDVAQSALRCFFAGIQDERFVHTHAGDTWRLLAALAVNRCRRQVERHTRGKRDVGREETMPKGSGSFTLVPREAEEPSPEEAAALAEEVELTLGQLAPLPRQMLELWLQGKDWEEISTATQRSQRTVRRTLEQIRKQLERRLLADNEP
jgi:RNA polymerase sigma factor (sigma-70 family)